MSNTDLGFIRNRTDIRGPNRVLFGAPGFTSKNSVMNQSPLFKAQPETNVIKSEISPPNTLHTTANLNVSLLEKRCEYLEKQDRQNREMLLNLTDELTRLRTQINENETLKSVYHEVQWVFGTVVDNIMGVQSDIEDSCKVMDSYDASNLIQLETTGQIMLVYPMVMKDGKGENDKQCFMRMKCIDEHTGQLSFTWVLVYELINDTETRYVTYFYLTQ